MKKYQIIADNLDNALKEIKDAWLIARTTKIKPTGYIGFEFVHYDKDDITIKEEIRAKTLKGLRGKIYKYLDHCQKDTKTEIEQAEICSNGKNVK